MNDLQRTDEWFSARRGRLTSSQFHRLMGARGLGKTGESYIFDVITELLTGNRVEFSSIYTDWGNEYEEAALKRVEAYLFDTIQSSEFIELNDGSELSGLVGGSPDGLTDEYMIEVKCPYNQVKQIERLYDPTRLFDEYQWQLAGNMWFTGKPKGLIASYDPRTQSLAVYEFTRKDVEKQIEQLKVRLHEAIGVYRAIEAEVRKHL